jgi:hypothetical protein
MPPHYEANASSPMLVYAWLKKNGLDKDRKKVNKEIKRKRKG